MNENTMRFYLDVWDEYTASITPVNEHGIDTLSILVFDFGTLAKGW